MKKQLKPILVGIIAATLVLVASSFVWGKSEDGSKKPEDPVFEVRKNVNPDYAPDADTLGDKQEVINKRDLMSATFANSDDLKNNRYTTSFSTAPIHYIDPDSGWYRNIDLNWQTDSDGSFKEEKNNYHSYAPKNSTDFDIAIFDNVFEDPKISTTQSNDDKYLTKTNRNHSSISYKPLDMKWVNDANGEELISNLQSVDGQADQNKVVYKNAFGNGNDIEIINLSDGLKKDIVLNNKIEPQTLSNADYLDISFELNLFETGKIKIKDKNDNNNQKDANDLKDNESIFTTEKIVIKDKNAENDSDETDLQSFIQPAKACGADGICQNIELKIEKKNSKLFLLKHIPKSFLDQDAFPIRTDTTTTFNSNSGGDGSTYTGSKATWDLAHHATTGSVYVGLGTTTSSLSGANYSLYRGFAPFDTSSLADGAVISSAIFKLYATSKQNVDTTSVHVVKSTQASFTALVAEDIDNVELTSYGTIDIAAIATSAYNSITLNASGISNISTTDYSPFAIRTGLDVNDIAPTGLNESANSNVTLNPFKLEVTYTVPGIMTTGKYWGTAYY